MSTNATARFNVVASFSERSLDKVLKALVDKKAFPTSFRGQQRRANADYGISVGLSYYLEFKNPKLFLDTDVENGVGLGGVITGKLMLCSAIEPRFGSDRYELEWSIDLDVEFEGIASVELKKKDNVGHLAVNLGMFDFTRFELLSISESAGERKELCRRLLRRTALVAFRKQLKSFAISNSFDIGTLAGWPIGDVEFVVIDGKSDDDKDNITLALSTSINSGRGRVSQLFDWINPDHDFGLGLDQRFITKTLHRDWDKGLIPRRFSMRGRPNPKGRIAIDKVNFDFQENVINFSTHITKPLPMWLHGSVALSVEDGRLAMDVKDFELDPEWWMAVAGYLAVGWVWIIVYVAMRTVVGDLLAVIADKAMEDLLDNAEIQLGFEGPIPNTGLKLVAIVNDLSIGHDELLVRGSVEVEDD